MSAADRLKAALQKRAELSKSINEEVSSVIVEGFKELFDSYPTLVSFSWKQYTPYFNDGDTCEFSAHTDPECISTEFTEDDGDRIGRYDRESDTIWDGRKSVKVEVSELDRLAHEVEKKVSEVLSGIPEDALEAVYGDHVEVIVDRKGAKTEEYYHD